MSFKFYTFSYNDPNRKIRMKERFSKEDIDIEFVDIVEQPKMYGTSKGKFQW